MPRNEPLTGVDARIAEEVNTALGIDTVDAHHVETIRAGKPTTLPWFTVLRIQQQIDDYEAMGA